MTEELTPDVLVPLLLQALEGAGVAVDPGDEAECLDLVTAAAAVERAGRRVLEDSARTARAGGASWSAIGSRLDMSRQAAQQRFGTTLDQPVGTERTKVLGPVTAFNELRELNSAGAQGWHSVGFGPLHHVVEHSLFRWEHRRTTWRSGVVSRQLEQGWQLIGTTFPWAYFKRRLEDAPATEPPDGSARLV